MFDFLKKFLAGSNEGEIRKLSKTVEAIGALEPQMQALTDDGMREYSAKLRSRAQGGESLDALLPEAYALAREAAVRVLGQRPFDVQLLGAIVLHQGRIAEMRTGEGKTLTAALPIENLSEVPETKSVYNRGFSHVEIPQEITRIYREIGRALR